MKLSIIILTWNSKNHITGCIRSIMLYTSEACEPYEIFVVDNGSSDGTLSLLNDLADQYPGTIKLILLSSNTGTTYSRNLALKKAQGEYVAIIDSDVILTSQIFDPLIQYLSDNHDVGLVAPGLIYKSGRYQKSTDHFPTIFSKFKRYFFLKYMEMVGKHLTTVNPYEVDYAISAFWVLPARVIINNGLLDESIFYAPEDVDYCLRLWKNGFSIVYYPTITAIHDAQEISRSFRLNSAFFKHLLGLFYYFKKHKYFLSRPAHRSGRRKLDKSLKEKNWGQ